MNISLPSELDEWVKSRADEIGVEPELLIQQLIDSYRTQTPDNAPEPAEDSRDSVGDLESAAIGALVEEKLESWLDGELDEAVERKVQAGRDDRVKTVVEETVDARVHRIVDGLLDERVDAAVENSVEKQVESVVDETVDNRVRAAVEQLLDESLDDRLDDRLEAALADLETEDEDLRRRLEALETKQTEDLADVRKRVIQVKKETDRKTPLQEFEGTRETVADIESEVESLDDRLAALSDDVDTLDGTIEDQEGALSEARDRLNTLAWNVKDLRTHLDALDEVDRLKRMAAESDIERAKCDNCDTGVSIGLLTEPACPHCDASVTDVAEASSFFGKPRLRTRLE